MIKLSVTLGELHSICNALNTEASNLERDVAADRKKGHTFAMLEVRAAEVTRLRDLTKNLLSQKERRMAKNHTPKYAIGYRRNDGTESRATGSEYGTFFEYGTFLSLRLAKAEARKINERTAMQRRGYGEYIVLEL